MTLQAASATARTTQGRLGAEHGYRIDGDFVHLNADVSCGALPDAAGQAWALQLWACAPAFAGTRPEGVRVAELRLGPVDAPDFHVNGMVAALPPAASGEHAMVLALVSGPDGDFDTLHDMVIYPRTQQFLQPRLVGDLTCRLGEAAVELNVAAIENPRPADNLSGTLALEVWSLDAPWSGGDWTGVPVASVVLGTLAGQCEWSACRFDAPAAVPARTGYLVVMLREWTPGGYVTRDCRTVAVPAAPAEVAAAPVAATKAAPAKAAKAATAAKPAAKEAGAAAKPAARAETKAAGVSINTASEAELVAVKGLGVAVARAIIAARPYAKLDDVCRAKGMGAKLLEKLRKQLSL